VRFVTIDFETYYDDVYSLTKLSTEVYVRDPRFEVILVGIKIDNEPPYWISGSREQIARHLASLELHKCAGNAHNMMFDGLILAIHFGIFFAVYCDTLAMAQAMMKPYQRSISLDSCLKALNLGIQKGDAVYKMKGRTRLSLSRFELQEYAVYCMDDCEGEYRAFKHLAKLMPREELEIIDITLRMYLQPRFLLNANLLAEELATVRAKKAALLAALPEGVGLAHMLSNEKFAVVLRDHGVEPPTKISPTTGLTTYAFAKTDTAWKELEEEWMDDDLISAILSARIGAKSTLEETRYQRLLDIALNFTDLRIPLRYYAAHPGRYGGMEGMNAQNFPRIDKSRMRYAIKAPKGHVVLAADLAQIEARIVAWLAKQKNLLEAFREHRDIYSEFATIAFGKETVKDRSPEDKRRRFVGKTCILGLGYGMGDTKLRATLRKDGVKLDVIECMKLVTTYRSYYSNIPHLWRGLESFLPVTSSGTGLMKVGPVIFAKHSVLLPNGMALIYHNLRFTQNDKYVGWVYDFAGETRTLWGGKMTENIVQALARILVMEYMLKIKHMIKLIPALQQHDELDYVVPERYAEKIAAVIGKIMRVPPTWAPDLPVEVEINFGPTLGDCK